MKYYLIKILTTETEEVREVIPMDSYDMAEREFYKVMSENIEKEGIKSVQAMAINSDNGIYNTLSKVWKKPEPIPEPTPETIEDVASTETISEEVTK